MREGRVIRSRLRFWREQIRLASSEMPNTVINGFEIMVPPGSSATRNPKRAGLELQPLTLPAVNPSINCLEKITNRISNGTTAKSVPANIPPQSVL